MHTRLLPPLMALVACAPPAPVTDPVFVRDGVIVPAPAEGIPLPGQRVLTPLAPDARHFVHSGRTWPRPERPACMSLFSVDLGDASRQVAMGGSAPDTALAWSGERLAVGTARGELLVLDGWTGRVLARRHLSETLVKQVAWGPDGTLYAGEQSPDALLHALDPDTLQSRWTLRLADRVETSPAPAGEDLYGVYTLPGITGLHVLEDGDLIVAATHAWPGESGRENRAQVLRVRPDGTVRAAWPPSPARATLLHPRVDEASGRVVVPVGFSAAGEPPDDLPVGGVQLLDLDLRPIASIQVPPLAPWFDRTFVWEGVDVDANGVVVGLGDGRVRTFDALGAPADVLDPGAPVMAGDVPIVAPIGHARRAGPYTLALTELSNIPYGAAAPDLQPPSPHPGAHTLWAWKGPDLAFRLSGPWALSGLSLSADARTAVVGTSPRAAGDRHRGDLFGALLVDLSPDGADGESRLLATCPTEGPLFFRHALHEDGRLAVVEVPRLEGSAVRGAWRVTVLR